MESIRIKKPLGLAPSGTSVKKNLVNWGYENLIDQLDRSPDREETLENWFQGGRLNYQEMRNWYNNLLRKANTEGLDDQERAHAIKIKNFLKELQVKYPSYFGGGN